MPIYYCDGRRLRRTIQASAAWLSRNRELVNALNVFPVPDGDTGTNMSMTLREVLTQLENTRSDNLPQVASAIADSSLWGARGSSGVILSQVLRGLAETVGEKERINSLDVALSLRTAARRAYAAVNEPAEGTILTLLKEAGERALKLAEDERDIVVLLRYVLETGERILVETKDLLPELRRAGVVDAGGKGLLLMIEGILRLIEGLELERIRPGEVGVEERASVAQEDISHRYCLDFVVSGRGLSVSRLKSRIEAYGDDLLAVGSGSVLKAHIHTDDPDAVLTVASTFGEVGQVKIDDMTQQHKEFAALAATRERSRPADRNRKSMAEKPIGLLAVASGEGLSRILMNVGVDVVVEGGPTMNPSVSDMRRGLERIDTDRVVILPNNSNILAAAEQVRSLAETRVEVIAAKTIPQGIAAAMAFSQERSMEENLDSMRSALQAVKTGELTRATRGGVFGGLNVSKGDCIGLYNGQLMVSGKEPGDTLMLLLSEMVQEEDSIISVFCGSTDEDVETLTQKIRKQFPELDTEVLWGGQPHYDYIVSVE